MSEALNNYLFLLNNLVRVRWLYDGMESDEEDKILDEMDSLWLILTDKERTFVQEIPSRSVIESHPKKIMQDMPPQFQIHRIFIDTSVYKEAA
jgi:hypothetical protein